VEPPEEAPAGAVVVPSEGLLGRKAEERRIAAGDPRAEAVERLAGEEAVLDQHGQDACGGDLRAAVVRWQEGREELLQPHPAEEVVEDRQRVDGPRPQDVAARGGLATRERDARAVRVTPPESARPAEAPGRAALQHALAPLPPRLHQPAIPPRNMLGLTRRLQFTENPSEMCGK
jgi:hypothetical protein